MYQEPILFDRLIDSAGILEQTPAPIAQGKERKETGREILTHSVGLINGLPIQLFGFDLITGRYNAQNAACRDFWGDIIGKRPDELDVSKDTLETWEKNRQRVLAGRVIHEEVVIKHAGEEKIFYNVLSPYLHNEQIAGMFGINIDITEIKRTKQQLLKTEEKYRELVENASSSILRIDADGKVTFINEYARKFFGFAEDEIIGNNVIGTVVPEEDSTGRDLSGLINDVTQNPGRHFNQINENIKKNGERVLTSWTNKPVYDAAGRLVEVLCIGNDITRENLANEALQKSKKRYRDLVDNANSIILHCDEKYNILFMNSYGLKFFGYKEEELIGRNLLDTIVPRSESRTGRNLALLIKNIQKDPEKYNNSENENVRKDGKRVWVAWTNKAIEVEDGNAVEILSVGYDITRLKNAEQEIKKQATDVQKMNRQLQNELQKCRKLENALMEREKALESRTRSLEETNTALRVLLDRREKDRSILANTVLSNMKQLVHPFLKKLKSSPLDPIQKNLLEVVETNFKQIVSPFSRNLSARYAEFTPSEIRVASLVKDGKATKEIAELLGASIATVDFHRKSLRKKLAITNKKIGLQSYLLTLE